jgi:hypothetical protein
MGRDSNPGPPEYEGVSNHTNAAFGGELDKLILGLLLLLLLLLIYITLQQAGHLCGQGSFMSSDCGLVGCAV